MLESKKAVDKKSKTRNKKRLEDRKTRNKKRLEDRKTIVKD